METPDPNAEREIFAAAAALPPEERAAYLDSTCVGRPELRANVEAWLDAHEPSEFMQAAEEELRMHPEQAGERIGNYKLLEKIGEGGFGVIWVADQEQPVRRRVALKIIKLGMDTKEVIARFGQERQALAMMDHPHIAKVLDAGATEWGRPYFVMELVRGIKITDYCDQANLSTADRLTIFIQVCQAVQHAHQKGIIHRDLKPSNILVTLHDGVPVPKVIDFGVAKATQQQRLTDLTIYTEFQQMIGTPVYMSPEQAEMSGLDIDTRSDIYSLGVLLYELLTGRTPFDPAELMRKGYDEIRHAIREQEPLTPSTFLRTMPDATRTIIAQHRQSDPAKLTKLVRGDLDWIVMKALEKDRSRRYETANGLAMDIQRHLASEPVHARPASQLYRLRRLVRRNRGVFAAAGAVMAALVIGLGLAIHSFLNERLARAGETKQREIAEEHSRLAQTSAIAAQAITREAAASELKAKRFLYAADMNLVQQALRSNNIGRARLLLDRHRPASGGPDLRGWEWRYLWQQCRSGAQALLTTRDGVRVFSVSFSPDGAWLAVGYFDGQVELWDVAKRQLARLVQEPFNQRAHVAFSPRGDVLAATMGRSSVKTHNIATGADTALCTVADYVRDLSFSPDGELLAVLSAGPDLVQVLRVADGESVMNYPLPSGGGMHFNNARLSPDQKRLYVSCGAFHDPRLRCVSVPEARLIWEIPIGRIEDNETDSGTDIGFTAMDLSPDGRTLVVGTGYNDLSIRVLDASTGGIVKKLAGHTGWACELTFSKDGRVLASASQDQTIRLWDTSTWRKLAEPLRGHTHEVHAVAFTGDASLLASGSKDGQVLLWSTHAPRPPNGVRSLPRKIERAVGLPVSRMIVGRTRDQQWSLIDLLTLSEESLPEGETPIKGGLPAIVSETRRRPRTSLDGRALGLTGFLRSTASADRNLLAVASEDGLVGLYDAETKAKVDVIRGNMGAVFGLAFSPDNLRLVLASGGLGGIEVWDATTRQVLLTLSTSGTLTTAVEFTDSGNTLLVGSEEPGSEGFCQFWSAPSWAEIDEAERTGGKWPQTETFQPPPPPPTLAETKRLLEKSYRDRLADFGGQPPGNARLREESSANLADHLHRQGRSAEAETLFRELLTRHRQRTPQDVQATLGAAKGLLSVLLTLMRTERESAEPGKLANYAQQADALVGEVLMLEMHSSEANPPDPLVAIKLAALQVWFGRDADHLATCGRLIDQAERKSNDADTQARAARSLCFRPSPDPALLDRALRLARHAADLETNKHQRGWYQQALGMAEYRSGNEAAAAEAMIRSEESVEQTTSWNPKLRPYIEGPARLFRAMILFRQGKQAEASELFAQAEALMPDPPADAREVLVNGVEQNDLHFWLTYKEARALLGPKK